MTSFFKNNPKKLTILTGLVILISFILLSPSIVSAVTCYYDPDICGSSYPYITNICGGTWCWSSCPQGDCCCMYWWNGTYYEYRPWCCYTAGSIPPTNCDCGESSYCCWPDSPVLCENSCWPAGTQCSSCNGQIAISPPTLISPSNGTTDVSTTPTLDWSDVVGADGWYHLYYKKSSETSWSVKSNLSYSRYTFSSSGALASSTTYQWNVRACNPGPVCENSETWSFTTGAAPPTITCPDCAPPKYLNDVVHLTVSATNEAIGIGQVCLGLKKEGQASENLCYDGCGGAASCIHTWPVTLDFSGTDPAVVDWIFYGIAQYANGQWSGWVGPIIIEEVIGVTTPTARTDPATNVEETTATLKGAVTDTGEADYRVRFNYGDTSSYGSDSGWTDYYSYTTSFTWDKTGLTRGKTYHFRIQAENSAGYGYGSNKVFTTKPDPPSSFTATATGANQIDLSWSKGSGAYYTMIRRKTGSYPTSPSDGTQAYYGTGTSKSDTGLASNTTYYYRAWSRAYEEGYYQYSDSYVSAWATTQTPVDTPTARTDPATSVEETTATLKGCVTDTGGADYRVRFNYGDTSSYGSNSGWTGYYSYTTCFTLDISGLTRGKTYHFRIQAENSAGYGYGSDKTFITKPDPPSSFSATAVSESQINLSWSKGSGAYYTMVRRKTGSYPTSPSDGTQAYYGTGTSKSDTGLTAGTTYYYRAWSRGYEEGYWSDYSDSYDSAYATTPSCAYPTGSISASKTLVDTGEQFTISITGYDDNDVWYISCNEGSNIWNSGTEQKCSFTQTECTREWNFTKSTAGTYTYYGRVRDSDDVHGCSSWHEAGIGSVTVIVTQADPPTARTDPATNVEETTATLKGAVTDTGGADYRVRFNYGDTSSYGSNSSWTDYYSYTTSFTWDKTGLTRGKTYHFRIEAENSAGSGYGSDKTFITKPDPPFSFTATTISSNQINLSWSKGSGAYYTMVRRKTGSYPTSPSDGTQAYYGTGTSKSDTGLTTGTTYYYRVWSRAYEETLYQYSDSYASGWATTFSGVCSSLSYPTDKWQRVWYEYDSGTGSLTNCIGDGPDESGEEFDTENIWDAGNLVGGYRDDHIGFKSSRSIYFKSSGYYHICAGSDDGINIWLDKDGNGSFSDDEWIFKRWQNRSYVEDCAFNVKIEGAGYHKMRIDYYEDTNDARVSFDLPSKECIGECGSNFGATWGSGCLDIIQTGCNTACAVAGYCPGEVINKYGCGASAHWGPYGTDVHCCCCNYAFELSTSPSSGSVGQGDSILTTVTFSRPCDKLGECDFSASGLPSGATVSFNPTNCKADWPGIPSCSSTMTISTASYTPLGAYPITIINTYYAKDNTEPTTYYLTVTEPKPDLVITNGWDATGTIRYTITNQGTGNAGESYTALYIKNTADNWVYKANDYEAALSAGSSRSGSEQSFPTYTLSDRATDCVDRAEMPVSVCADYYSPRVDESNEGNNCFEFTVPCDATPPTATITTNPSPTNNWFRDDFTAQFEFRDSGGSGLAVCQYKIECDGWTTDWLNKPCSGNGPVNASRVVGVGAGEECNAQGYDACKIYAHVEDGAGNSPPDPEEAYGIDYEAPTTE